MYIVLQAPIYRAREARTPEADSGLMRLTVGQIVYVRLPWEHRGSPENPTGMVFLESQGRQHGIVNAAILDYMGTESAPTPTRKLEC